MSTAALRAMGEGCPHAIRPMVAGRCCVTLSLLPHIIIIPAATHHHCHCLPLRVVVPPYWGMSQGGTTFNFTSFVGGGSELIPEDFANTLKQYQCVGGVLGVMLDVSWFGALLVACFPLHILCRKIWFPTILTMKVCMTHVVYVPVNLHVYVCVWPHKPHMTACGRLLPLHD